MTIYTHRIDRKLKNVLVFERVQRFRSYHVLKLKTTETFYISWLVWFYIIRVHYPTEMWCLPIGSVVSKCHFRCFVNKRWLLNVWHVIMYILLFFTQIHLREIFPDLKKNRKYYGSSFSTQRTLNRKHTM